jgi:hypothetical protein
MLLGGVLLESELLSAAARDIARQRSAVYDSPAPMAQQVASLLARRTGRVIH